MNNKTIKKVVVTALNLLTVFQILGELFDPSFILRHMGSRRSNM
jgi:hypothetical protein